MAVADLWDENRIARILRERRGWRDSDETGRLYVAATSAISTSSRRSDSAKTFT